MSQKALALGSLGKLTGLWPDILTAPLQVEPGHGSLAMVFAYSSHGDPGLRAATVAIAAAALSSPTRKHSPCFHLVYSLTT